MDHLISLASLLIAGIGVAISFYNNRSNERSQREQADLIRQGLSKDLAVTLTDNRESATVGEMVNLRLEQLRSEMLQRVAPLERQLGELMRYPEFVSLLNDLQTMINQAKSIKDQMDSSTGQYAQSVTAMQQQMDTIRENLHRVAGQLLQQIGLLPETQTKP